MFVCLILGLVLAAQFKNVQNVGGSVSLQRAQELTTQIQWLNAEISGYQQRIRDLERTLWEYENSAKDEGKINEALYKDLEKTRILGGLVDLEGPGVVVTVNVIETEDWMGETRIVRNVYHDDLLRIVNELNAAGAEAISINDERIIATSEIRDAGSSIVINTHRHTIPFEIKAIGNPDTLEASLKLLGGVIDTLGAELEIKIKREDSIKITKYQYPIKYDYAKPVQ